MVCVLSEGQMRYDKEHKDSLSKYPELKERMQSLLQNGEKITPKQWKAEIISYNRKNLERELQNGSRQHNTQQNKTKQREEEI